MTDGDEDTANDEWTGRPQDDPRLRALQEQARAAFRERHPPVNCWIDRVHVIELYLDGRLRARVLPRSALALLFDAEGGDSGSFCYLRSECAYDAVEKFLGIVRVAEVRDESDEGGGKITPRPRETSEKDARAFREQCGPQQEAARYLQDAIGTFDFFGGAVLAAGRAWRTKVDVALAALARDDRKAALEALQNALAGISGDTLLDWQAAWVDCARAAEALRRDLPRRGDRAPVA